MRSRELRSKNLRRLSTTLSRSREPERSAKSDPTTPEMVATLMNRSSSNPTHPSPALTTATPGTTAPATPPLTTATPGARTAEVPAHPLLSATPMATAPATPPPHLAMDGAALRLTPPSSSLPTLPMITHQFTRTSPSRRKSQGKSP